ncbi:MAG: helix-turn-helix domain-containing protein [Azoarcus sp.]|jgi:transcriptional regulator with XRE-family HTH domain|nr:helix-turn-helix domain-containing protein [Azoarcus sp.]
MAKTSPSLFGLRMRAARLDAGLSQERLGVLIGLDEQCSSARISRYEGGVHEPPFRTAEQIALALDVPVAYFYCPDDALAQLLLLAFRLDEAGRGHLEQTAKSLIKADSAQ